MNWLAKIVEGALIALLKYFCPKIYECLHTPSTIEEVHTDPKLAKKYANAYEEWKAKKDSADAARAAGF